jgi:ribosome maturation factor RimP
LKKLNINVEKDLNELVESADFKIFKIQFEKIPDLDPIINIQIENINLKECYNLSKKINDLLDKKYPYIQKKYIIDVSTKEIKENNEN